MAKAYARKPLSFFNLGDNVRLDLGEEAELRKLGQSLGKGQIQPVIARTGGTLLDGYRRLRAAELEGLGELDAILTDDPLSPEEIVALQFESAVFREGLTGWEQSQAVLTIAADHADWTTQKLAEHLSLDAKMIRVLQSPARCHPDVQDALRRGAIAISTCHDISLLPHEEQLPLLALALSGASRDEVARAGRKRRNGSSPASARASKIRIEQASGTRIVIQGEAMDLETIVESLAAAVKDARKALADGLDAKTWASVCRDRAKAGV